MTNSGSEADNEKTAVLPETAAELVEHEQLKAELAASEERAKSHWDQYLRSLADIENIRKRAARDLESARQFAIDRFAQELLDVKDSLELAVQNATQAGAASLDLASLVEGQNATLRLLEKAFEKNQIVTIDPVGTKFDPEMHEAMMAQPAADVPPNTVLAVVQRGYQLNGRLLRPARVIVAQSP